MTTTSTQLDAYADAIESSGAWTMQNNWDLYNLIAEPSQTLQQRTLKPPTNNCFDTIIPYRPAGWTRSSMSELAGPLGGGALCTLSLWDTNGLLYEVYPIKKCATITLALLATTARAWSYLLRQAGR